MSDQWTYTDVVAPSASREAPRVPRAAPPIPGSPNVVRGRYDAAQTSDNNRRHWQWADALSAKAAANPAVRRILRMRSRYERDNNCYASGITETLADDMIGCGPKLQMQTGDEELDRSIESEFMEWSEKVCLADKLHTMRQARAVDGEAFMFLETDRSLGPITLDLRLYEADQVASPYPFPIDPLMVDGIILNQQLKPKTYHLLKEHPGDSLAFTFGFEFDEIPAKYVIHWFLRRRPGQYRGIPELTPALPLFAMLRRFGLATLSSAEIAAAFSAVVYTDLPPEKGIDQVEPFEGFDYEHGMFTTIPAGWKMDQFRAEHPSSNHEMFKRCVLEEIARTLGVPYNIASGNSSGYNYASGRLDHQTYYRKLYVDQSRAERVILNPVLFAWMEEAALTTRLIRGGLKREGGWPHLWLWPGLEHVDPFKEANAQEKRLQNLTTTFTEECYKDGVDREQRIRMIAKDIDDFAKMGIPSPYGRPVTGGSQPSSQDQQDKQDQQDQQDEGGGNGTQNQGSGYSGEPLLNGNGHHRP